MITVESIRDLNNTYSSKQTRTLVCPDGCGTFSADLARYWRPRDKEWFLCPHCDSYLGLRFEQGDDDLAQLTAFKPTYV